MTPDQLAEIKARVVVCSLINDKDPYVTVRGGIVLLNGPYPIGQANAIAKFYRHARTDIPALIVEVQRLQGVLSEMTNFNPLMNDRDAYLLAMCEWGIKGKWGVDLEFTERPVTKDFGLDYEP